MSRAVKLTADQRRLLDDFLKLDQSGRDSLLAFAEFLAGRAGKSGTNPSDPAATPKKVIPRPKEETVIGAIKRLAETYPMIDRQDLLTETSALMSAHIMQGRMASEVIDDLEALFANHYKRHNSGGN